MGMRNGVLSIITGCILLSLTTLLPLAWQGAMAGLLTICLAAVMIYCLASRWRYLAGNLTIRKGAYLLIHLGFIVLVAAGVVGMHGQEYILELHEQHNVDLTPWQPDLQVRADQIRAEYYENGLPRQYYTTLSFLDGGMVINTQTISVNHPVGYRGLYFYQSGYYIDQGQVSVLKVKTKPERLYLWSGILLLGTGVCLWLCQKE